MKGESDGEMWGKRTEAGSVKKDKARQQTGRDSFQGEVMEKANGQQRWTETRGRGWKIEAGMDLRDEPQRQQTISFF